MKHDKIFELAHMSALEYMDTIDERPVFPSDDAIEKLKYFDEPLPVKPCSPEHIIKMLHEYGSPATLAQTGGRYFGFVNGGAIPISLAVKWLADVWDQDASAYVCSPISAKLEDICEKWLVDLLDLPKGTAAGFVSGSATAILIALIAARNYILSKCGYNVATKGLLGAPEIKVILSEGAHSSVYRALSIIGLGSDRVTTVPMDSHGRINKDQMPELNDRTILILQAGNVNSGSFDDFQSICANAKKTGAWIHIDGAFGLWASASSKLKHLTTGIEHADSWSVSAHKAINAPYDNGIIFCKERNTLLSCLQMSGAYIEKSNQRDGMDYTLDMSRRSRVIEIWALLKSLGKKGVSDLIEDLHEKSVYFANKLEELGYQILNQIWFNQILVASDSSEETNKILRYIQDGDALWCGGSEWDGRRVIRLSLCSYCTTYEDLDLCIEVFAEARNIVKKEVN